MENLSTADWFGFVSFLVAVLSLFFNFIQWRKEKALQQDVALRTVAGMNAGYQAIWRIAVICDKVRQEKETENDKEKLLSIVLANVQEITGNADAGRATMNAICRDLVGKRLFYEPPWETQNHYIDNSNNNS